MAGLTAIHLLLLVLLFFFISKTLTYVATLKFESKQSLCMEVCYNYPDGMKIFL